MPLKLPLRLGAAFSRQDSGRRKCKKLPCLKKEKRRACSERGRGVGRAQREGESPSCPAAGASLLEGSPACRFPAEAPAGRCRRRGLGLGVPAQRKGSPRGRPPEASGRDAPCTVTVTEVPGTTNNGASPLSGFPAETPPEEGDSSVGCPQVTWPSSLAAFQPGRQCGNGTFPEGNPRSQFSGKSLVLFFFPHRLELWEVFSWILERNEIRATLGCCRGSV